jgi:hypothetical protein
MKKTVPALLFLIWMAACHSNKTADKAKESNGIQNTVGQSDSTTTQYKWSKAEQDKFLKACQTDFADDFTGDELKDVCNCILAESQKYYPSYSQMKKVPNEDFEDSIAMACLGKYLDDSDH